jgi:hypothetical protein
MPERSFLNPQTGDRINGVDGCLIPLESGARYAGICFCVHVGLLY